MEGEMKRTVLMIFALGVFFFVQLAQADWTEGRRLTSTAGDSTWPAMAVDSSKHLHLFWQDDTPGNYEIYYMKSTDGGAHWTAATRLTWTPGHSCGPVVAIDAAKNLHVVWEEFAPREYEDTPESSEIYYMKSTDGGAHWTAATRLTSTDGKSSSPAIAVDPWGFLHLVWEDEAAGNWEVYYKKSTDGGAHWTAATRLTWTTVSDEKVPDIAVDFAGNLHVVYRLLKQGNNEIYYMRKEVGDHWRAARRLTWTARDSTSPAIVVDPWGYLQLVWMDSTPGNYEVYYMKSINGGASWSANQRLTSTAGFSGVPAIVVDSSNNIHVVWCDDTSGNAEIYYRKGN
jgi:BNR repeat-like domain